MRSVRQRELSPDSATPFHGCRPLILMVKTYLTFLEGSRYPCAQTCGSSVEADPDTGILVLCSRPDGKNGPILPLIHVYYTIVHESP